MYLLTVSLYEFGQFLRILLWISVPLVILSMLITTYLHYRRKDKTQEGLVLSVDGYDPQDEGQELIASRLSPMQMVTPADSFAEAAASEEKKAPEEDKENMYKGILWMKEKFEQYRDLADQRYEQLKDELNRSEKKYEDLLASQSHPSLAFALSAAEEGDAPDLPGESAPPLMSTEQVSQLEFIGEQNRRVEELEQLLQVERQKVEELVVKLQDSSQLLLNIYQELDKSLNAAAIRSILASQQSAAVRSSAAPQSSTDSQPPAAEGQDGTTVPVA